MSKIELKPCPFCGGAGQLLMMNYGYATHPTRILNSYYVKCVSCGIKTPAYDSNIRQEDNGTITIKANGAELAAETWNMRFEDAIENPIDDGVYVSTLRLPLNLEEKKNEN